MTATTKRTARRTRVIVDDHDDKPDERWMASYMDMVTVLMCLFIVLFAMSTIDQQKLEDFAGSFTGAAPAAPNSGSAATPTPLEQAQQDIADLQALQATAQAALDAAELGSAAQFQLSERGLSIQLVGTETYFAGNSIELSEPATRVLNAVGPTIASSGRTVSVEGHADSRGQSGAFASDWELSSGRATQVLRHLVELNGVTPTLIGATGFGSARPAGGDEATNRRVDVVIESNQPDNVRALMAELLTASP